MRIILDTDKMTITVPWNYAQKLKEMNAIIEQGGGTKVYKFDSYLKEVMKKSLAIMLVLVMAMSFIACGKSQAVKDVEAAISSIGEITLDSDQSISNAEKLYKGLSEKDAQTVENYTELTGAREKYNALVYEAAIGNMESYDYDKAISLLESIPSYKDAQAKLEEANDGVFQSECASYIFNFIKDGSFYNPSAVRVLDASYGDKSDTWAALFGADGILYLKIQGTNKFGGTLSKEYVILIGGKDDGKAYKNEDDITVNYKQSDKAIDVPTINKMLQKYWKDYGIE